MKWIDAIIAVLAEEKAPMHYEEITKRILNKRYRTPTATTENTVNSYLSTNPKLFKNLGRGYYELIETSVTAPHFHKIEKESLTVDETVGREALVVVSPCTSYTPSDSKYKHASDFLEDSLGLSKLEMDLLELIVNFRLPLVEGEVCFADILDKLEVKILEEEGSRTQSIDATLLKNKLDELKRQIAKIERDIQNDPQLSNLDEGLLSRMRSAANGVEQLLHRASDGKVECSITLFGEFVPESKPKVVLYYKSIKNNIGRFESCWAVMAAVFVHEMFHAWNYFNAGQKSRSILAIDEPMVEFETLYFLKELEAFTQSQSHHLYDKVSSVKTDRKYRVQNKQQSIGDVAAYGFGYYLFDKLSRSNVDSRIWIETYSKKSAYIDGSHLLVNNVKDALIPIYPFTSQDKVMESFKKIIFGRQATYVTVGKSTSDKIGQDVSLRDLVLACIKTIGRKCFDAKELYVFAPIFKVCIPQFENLENTLKSQLDELVKESLLNALPDDCYSIKSSIEVKSTSAPTLTPAPTKSKGSYTKDPSIPFVVEFPNDNVIFNEKKAVKTFIKSLQHIGLSKVQKLNIMIRGYNLVSDYERPREGKNKWQEYVDNKYIYTKLGNPGKITYLYRIATELGIEIKIDSI